MSQRILTITATLVAALLGAAAPARAQAPQPRLKPLKELLAERPQPGGLQDPGALFAPGRKRPPFRVASILNTDLCPVALRRGFPIVSQGLAVQLDLLRSIRIVETTHRALRSTLDPKVMDLFRPGESGRVCVGVYDDGGTPNAVAAGQETILFGTSLFERFRTQDTADAQLTFVLLHELAHLLQNRHGRDYTVGQGSTKLVIATKRRKELVADCVAGSLYATTRGGVTPTPELEALFDLFDFLGASHQIATHGRACQRRGAFLHGYRHRVKASPHAGGVETSGTTLAACEAAVDTPDFVWQDCP